MEKKTSQAESADKTKRVRLSVDCSTEEKLAIKTLAKKNGKTISEYILDMAKTGLDLSENSKAKSAENLQPSVDDFWDNLGYK